MAFESPCPAQPLRDPLSWDSRIAANSCGVRSPRELCGRSPLYSSRHASIFARASASVANQCAVPPLFAPRQKMPARILRPVVTQKPLQPSSLLHHPLQHSRHPWLDRQLSTSIARHSRRQPVHHKVHRALLVCTLQHHHGCCRPRQTLPAQPPQFLASAPRSDPAAARIDNCCDPLPAAFRFGTRSSYIPPIASTTSRL